MSFTDEGRFFSQATLDPFNQLHLSQISKTNVPIGEAENNGTANVE